MPSVNDCIEKAANAANGAARRPRARIRAISLVRYVLVRWVKARILFPAKYAYLLTLVLRHLLKLKKSDFEIACRFEVFEQVVSIVLVASAVRRRVVRLQFIHTCCHQPLQASTRDRDTDARGVSILPAALLRSKIGKVRYDLFERFPSYERFNVRPYHVDEAQEPPEASLCNPVPVL